MKKIPSSVYHLQLGKNFPLKKAIRIIPYLYDLGIEGICCSPIFESFSNGYDVTNPNKINPILGSPQDYEQFCDQLQRHGIKQILNIVPNHMGIKGNKNVWWMDVLEKGHRSDYADFFDINWTPEKKELRGKILLPILGGPYESVLKKGEIQLIWKDGFWTRYFDYLLPICYASYHNILIPNRYKNYSKERLISLYKRSRSLRSQIDKLVSLFNKKTNLLHEILEKQFYRLSDWINAGQEINYRRFCNINEMIAIHIEKKKVLEAHHRLAFDLIAKGKVQGLRIDHIDGLYDPSQYLERIRKKKPALIWIEKILLPEESLPEKWDIGGTVGYEFLNVLNGIFIQAKNKQKLTDLYHQFVHKTLDYKEIYYEKRKKYILFQMSGEVNILGSLLAGLAAKKQSSNSFSEAALTKACLEIIACFPVYRTYIKHGSRVRKKDREYVIAAIEMAKTKAPDIAISVFNYVRGILLLEQQLSPAEKKMQAHFLSRFQQLTPAIMAEGIEDSAFYTYNRFISLNEVANNPDQFGFSKMQFHQFNQEKLKSWPLGELSSSTHDSKYSEDARLRLHVLSELPKKWKSLVFAWKKENKKHLVRVEGILFPEPNTEYFIYQMIISLWPADPKRLWTCLNKAIREANDYTSWRNVNEKYETAVKHFLDALLKKPNKGFLQFQKEVAAYGYWNSLSALVLKIGSCGIMGVYQGDELMNFSLMDPDNRRPIDFAKRKKEILKPKDLKMRITAKGLHFRRAHKELFLKGDYLPLKTPEHVIAFARKWKQEEVIILSSRFFTEKQKKGTLKFPSKFHGKTFQDLFTNRKITIPKEGLPFYKIFDPYPFAILIQSVIYRK